jgi:hypothetical protein
MAASYCAPVCFLCLHLELEDRGNMFLRNISGLSATTWRCIPDDRTLHNHSCENFKSYTNLHSISVSLSLSIYLWPYSHLLDVGHFFSFLILYTVGRTPWTRDQPVARPLPTHRTTQTQNKRTHRHPCLECVSNPRSQRSSERRELMP